MMKYQFVRLHNNKVLEILRRFFFLRNETANWYRKVKKKKKSIIKEWFCFHTAALMHNEKCVVNGVRC